MALLFGVSTLVRNWLLAKMTKIVVLANMAKKNDLKGLGFSN